MAVSSGWSVLMTGAVDLKLNVFKLWNGKSAPVKANVERVQIHGRAKLSNAKWVKILTREEWFCKFLKILYVFENFSDFLRTFAILARFFEIS